MRIWDDIAALPAWAITIGWLLLMFGLPPYGITSEDSATFSATFTGGYGTLTVGPLSWAAFVFPVLPLWYFAVYRSAASRGGRTLLRDAVFATEAIGYLVFVFGGAALYERAAEPPAPLLITVIAGAVLFGLGLFGGMAVAAASLNELDKKPDGGAYSNFGTFALMFYLPIGIWFMQPRISCMITRPTRSETST